MISIRKINLIFPLEHKNVRGDRHVKKMGPVRESNPGPRTQSENHATRPTGLSYAKALNKYVLNNGYLPAIRAKKYDCNFYIGNEKIDMVQSYTYLGSRTSSTRNFTLSTGTVKRKGSSCSV